MDTLHPHKRHTRVGVLTAKLQNGRHCSAVRTVWPMTMEAIRCSTVTDPQAGEFCRQQPHNIALHRAEPQDRNECKTVRPARDLTFDGNAASSETAHPGGRFGGRIAVQHTLSGCAHIRCSTVTDPQAGEFCHQQPHNIALHRAEPQDRNECKTVRTERGLTFDGSAASSETAHPRGHFGGRISVQHTLSGCPHGVAHDRRGN